MQSFVCTSTLKKTNTVAKISLTFHRTTSPKK